MLTAYAMGQSELSARPRHDGTEFPKAFLSSVSPFLKQSIFKEPPLEQSLPNPTTLTIGRMLPLSPHVSPFLSVCRRS